MRVMNRIDESISQFQFHDKAHTSKQNKRDPCTGIHNLTYYLIAFPVLPIENDPFWPSHPRHCDYNRESVRVNARGTADSFVLP